MKKIRRERGHADGRDRLRDAPGATQSSHVRASLACVLRFPNTARRPISDGQTGDARVGVPLGLVIAYDPKRCTDRNGI